MCKLLIILGTKKPNETKKFMGAILSPMSKGNSDGIGYTAVRSNGDMFTERWLNNTDGLRGDPADSKEADIKKAFGKLVDVKEVPKNTYSSKGEVSWGDVTSVIMHTRFATCTKGFDNVHPFVDNENHTAIAHNGVISNHKKFKKLNSTCDSETILTEYNRLKVGEDHNNAMNLINSIEGYWAVGATTLDSKGKRVIDVFTSNSNPGTGSLCVAYVKELEGFVMCSSSVLIKDALRELGWDMKGDTYSINPHVFTRFDSVTGKKLQLMDYSKNMVQYQVKKGNYGQSKTHCTYKGNADKDRRLLSQNSTNSANSNTKSGGAAGSKGGCGMGTSVCGVVGRVATFYHDLGGQTISNKGSSDTSTTKGLTDAELKALDYYGNHYGPSKNDLDSSIEDSGAAYLNKQDKIDNNPANYTGKFSTAMTQHQSEIDNDLSNFLDEYDSASDSKYPQEILNNELSSEELDVLDEFEAELNEYDKDILGGLPVDMKYKFLNDMKAKKA